MAKLSDGLDKNLRERKKSKLMSSHRTGNWGFALGYSTCGERLVGNGSK